MIIWAFNLLILSVGILIIGLIKPKWLLFWMERPNRYVIVAVSSIMLMAAAILFGEGNRQNAPLSEVVQGEKPAATEIPSDLVK
ncbi:conserved hypothetical protein [Bathymodiolus platifrons methanotrophic gill symbiont]|uniref:hypothetical protein n=1 Tax=Bathymodiolus platifrons methanotrophic gill symbiont TaxID=113268 RepID=UPI000B41A8F4|nr:hypothetical protein [Bathymodiolus platifrons methanotrophic gill symbiont]MCK5870586.1 hypothetical protein [Methyloprofundus sp.]TXK94798.1 hypothetical protein BMR11_14605 [Methylococcaceae bacterium CS5]TXK94834.1 hypothetical protein BMR02_13550 [Methylococcaceae bacterium HT1]TXK96022.1 hypothetical protein BMR10_08925 [Methylococcaceae bacterium CS4]TXL05443.1 hypothetical protein BMR07_09840 [Methylococcaceae bacterium CS1]TXL05816.1 hypothetical protein BMR09_09220 [Methylococcac